MVKFRPALSRRPALSFCPVLFIPSRVVIPPRVVIPRRHSCESRNPGCARPRVVGALRECRRRGAERCCSCRPVHTASCRHAVLRRHTASSFLRKQESRLSSPPCCRSASCPFSLWQRATECGVSCLVVGVSCPHPGPLPEGEGAGGHPGHPHGPV